MSCSGKPGPEREAPRDLKLPGGNSVDTTTIRPIARFQGELGAVEDMQLPLGAAFDMLLAPLPLRLAVFAKHALAAARRVDQHPVEPTRKCPAELLGMAA